MWIVCILRSERDGSFYTGYSEDVLRRLRQHNNGESYYTKRKMPWSVVYAEKFELKGEAIKRERFLKKQKNKEFYERLIKDWSGSLVG